MPASRQGIIGGLFGLAVPSAVGSATAPPFPSSRLGYFLNARCAIHQVCCGLKPKAAWLPSYLCSALIEPFNKLGVAVRYYHAGPKITNSSTDWVRDVASGDFVLVIHYFGFPNDTLPTDEVNRRGGVIVEDASQALFVKQQYPGSSCIVYSPRKFFGVPDGGVLATSDLNVLDSVPLDPPPTDWCTSAYTMTQMRREFDLLGGENRWFPLFRRVEESFPLGPYRSSDLARMLIEVGTDYDSMKKARRENYSALLARLREFALFPELDDETVPQGFPVCVDASQRDEVLERLYAQGIYPPVHWRLEGIVPEGFRDSHLLSRRILTLICDQRYTISDMARQADAFLSAMHAGAHPGIQR
jgi:hypothetical protein